MHIEHKAKRFDKPDAWVYGRFKNYNSKVDRACSARIIDEKNNYINVIPETACEFVGEKDSYNKKLYLKIIQKRKINKN